MKNIFKFLIILFITISLFGINSKQADAYSICSSGQTRCAHTFLFYGTDKVKSTNSVWFSKNEQIWWSWSNESPGIFHTNIAIYNGTTKIYGYHSIPHGGLDGGYLPAPSSGYYHLVALCSDGKGEKRCEGGGKIFYQ